MFFFFSPKRHRVDSKFILSLQASSRAPGDATGLASKNVAKMSQYISRTNDETYPLASDVNPKIDLAYEESASVVPKVKLHQVLITGVFTEYGRNAMNNICTHI